MPESLFACSESAGETIRLMFWCESVRRMTVENKERAAGFARLLRVVIGAYGIIPSLSFLYEGA